MGLTDSMTYREFQLYVNPEIDQEYNIKNESNQKFAKKVYTVIFIIYVIVGLSSLIMFYHLRNWYIIKQRNFKLTFIQGIFAFYSGAITLLVQIIDTIPCPVSLVTSDIVNPFYNAIFLSRSLRIILLYHFNIFKVTALKKKGGKFKLRESYVGEKEPNYYLPKVYKRVNNIIYVTIIVPTIIAAAATFYIYMNNQHLCPIHTELSATAKMKAGKDLNPDSLFIVARVAGIILAIALFIMLFFLARVKDSSKYGAKFECISTIILIVIITAFNSILNGKVQPAMNIYNTRKSHVKDILKKEDKDLTDEDYDMIRFQSLPVGADPSQQIPKFDLPNKLLATIFEYTKGGRVLFCIISMYMIFSSIILPIIKCYNSKKEKNKYFHEPTSSIQYFYKVLNSPPLIEELKSIAIKEFSVENVLFWENYQILQKMVYRYQIEYRKAEIVGNPKLVSQYDFEGYYQQQLATFSVSSMDEYSYDPNMPVPRELMPYYVNFYHTFIDSLGPASVNISGATIKQIYGEMCTYPTIGMFDNAKNEIVEMMYSSIFPILLRQNRKQIRNITVQY